MRNGTMRNGYVKIMKVLAFISLFLWAGSHTMGYNILVPKAAFLGFTGSAALCGQFYTPWFYVLQILSNH